MQQSGATAAEREKEKQIAKANVPHWHTINTAITNAKEYGDIWRKEVTSAYLSLEGSEAKMQAESLLKTAISRFKDVKCADYMRYLKSAARTKQRADLLGSSNVTKFPGLENKQQLFCGDYTCNDKGVYRNDECICNHPLYISKLVQPIDESGAAHVELSYYIDEKWQSIIRPRRAIYDRRQILGLSEIGLDITSENAGDIIQYFRTLEGWSGCAPADDSEPRTIPKIDGFARFGWFNNKFMPLNDGDSFKAYFTGAVEYENVFNAFGRKGDFDKWLEVVKPFYAPKAHPAVRTALAAATASVLLGYIDSGLPFFVHLFGASGNGKTLTLKLVASMFGNPSADGGGLIQSFSSTPVGLERRAEVLNNVPMLLDELGVKGGSTEREVSELVYQLTEGVGKTRGARELSLIHI